MKSDLARPAFFGGNPDAPALRRLHLAAGLALLATLGLAPGGDTWWYWAAVGLLGLIVLVVVFLGDPERSGSVIVRQTFLTPVRRYLHGQASAAALGLVVLSAVSLAGSAVRLYLAVSEQERTTTFPGIDWFSFVLLLTAVAGLVLLFVANGLLALAEHDSPARTRSTAFAPFAKGLACTLMASLGTFLCIGYAGASTVAVATALKVPVPEVFSRAVYAWGVTTLVVVVLALAALLHYARTRRSFRDHARRDFSCNRKLMIPPRWIGAIAGAMWTARLKNHLVLVFTVFAVTGSALIIGAVCELWPWFTRSSQWPQLTGNPVQLPWGFGLLSGSSQYPGTTSAGAALLLWIGTLVLGALATWLVYLGRTAITTEATRRGINVVWDVISFWPRSAHPFVPPAYSQRAVPDVANRIRYHVTPPGGGAPCDVVLCGHSQGSLLAFAALLRLAAEDDLVQQNNEPRNSEDTAKQDHQASKPHTLNRVGLLTFGSQLQLLFAKTFPAYVNQSAIQVLFQQLGGRWCNLYRDTDPLAGPVLSWGHGLEQISLNDADKTDPSAVSPSRYNYGRDWCLLDPEMPTDVSLQQGPLQPLRRHSNFWRDPAWSIALTAVRPH